MFGFNGKYWELIIKDNYCDWIISLKTIGKILIPALLILILINYLLLKYSKPKKWVLVLGNIIFALVVLFLIIIHGVSETCQ